MLIKRSQMAKSIQKQTICSLTSIRTPILNNKTLHQFRSRTMKCRPASPHPHCKMAIMRPTSKNSSLWLEMLSSSIASFCKTTKKNEARRSESSVNGSSPASLAPKPASNSSRRNSSNRKNKLRSWSRSSKAIPYTRPCLRNCSKYTRNSICRYSASQNTARIGNSEYSMGQLIRRTIWNEWPSRRGLSVPRQRNTSTRSLKCHIETSCRSNIDSTLSPSAIRPTSARKRVISSKKSIDSSRIC